MKAYDIAIIAMFVALMSVAANITSIFPFMVIGGVPITFQTFIAILSGVLLGSRRGSIAMLVYMLVGLFGAPVFAQFSGGPASLVSPNFGFVVSFVATAFASGKIIEKSSYFQRGTYFLAAFTGLALNYLIGTNWMYWVYVFIAEAPEGFTYALVWIWMILPFIKDTVFTAFAALIALRLPVLVKTSAFPERETPSYSEK